MPGLYTIKVITDFSAAHVIHGYDGPCGRLHGHNWKVEAVVVGSELNSIGICIDFKDVKKILRQVLDQVEHQNLNEIYPFTEINPTAENIAAWVYQEMRPLFKSFPVQLKAINIWETDRAMVCYTEEN
jgi:6-pyruvoyltetrahydropterin/6-carboxytetrahydropterin synthase